MNNLLENTNNIEQVNLENIAHYVTDKVKTSKLSLDDYISTENMLPERGGVTRATKLPTNNKVTKFVSGDTLTSNIRPYFKKIWQATSEGGCSNDILVIRSSNKEKLHDKFLYYSLSKDNFFKYSVMSSHGTKMPRGDKDAIMRYKISLPPIKTQEKITEILGTYDEKIKNNDAIIQSLEKIAETIFKEWFIDFRFPGYEKSRFTENKNGKLPKNWELSKIIDFGDVVCGKTPSKKNVEYFGGEIPFIKIPDMHGQVFIDKTADTLSTKGASTQANKFIPKNSVCVSCIATVGLVSITMKDSQTNQQINSLVPEKDEYLPYLYIALKRLKGRLQAIGSGGSTTLNVNTGTFSNIPLVKPEEKTLKDFNTLVRPMFTKIQGLLEENQKLSEMRDLLLNKLI